MKFVFLFVVAALLFVVPHQEEFKPITVYLVRHAERADEPRQDPPLTEKALRDRRSSHASSPRQTSKRSSRRSSCARRIPASRCRNR